jgi:hypothetical protein
MIYGFEISDWKRRAEKAELGMRKADGRRRKGEGGLRFGNSLFSAFYTC